MLVLVSIYANVYVGPAVMVWPEFNNADWAYGELDVFEGSNTSASMTTHWSPTRNMETDHRVHGERQTGICLFYAFYS